MYIYIYIYLTFQLKLQQIQRCWFLGRKRPYKKANDNLKFTNNSSSRPAKSLNTTSEPSLTGYLEICQVLKYLNNLLN